MIVVIGSPLFVPGNDGGRSGAGGLAAEIAAAAAEGGRDVQLVGRVGEDPAGEATLLALARAGIGHVATLRDAARPTRALPPPVPADPEAADGDLDRAETLGLDAGPAASSGSDLDDGTSLGPSGSASLDADDLELALRYLDAFSVVVVAESFDPRALAVAADAAAYAGAALIVLVRAADGGGDAPAAATVLEAPASDPDGVFARTIGAFAAELDRGTDPALALAAVVAAQGWQRAED